MRFDVLTIFPEIINAYISESIIKRAIQKGIIEVRVHNIRDYTTDKHRQVDDYPYGGGAGMVFKPEPLFRAIEAVTADGIRRHRILTSPGGRIFTQKVAKEYAEGFNALLIVCGRYEGVDERVKCLIDEEVSIGDYILTGGELASLVIIDAVSRLLPGVLGDEASAEDESFSSGLLEYPQYTRPAEFRGMRVPDVLLSGNHGLIKRWRRKESLRRTLRQRPELIEKAVLTDEDKKLLKEIKEEEGWMQ
ncbi:MAG: tRNA (guanosine(37)-N1)-methyltransferase TrmD [Nitrospirae bacterium]|nr:MAG: tRNA (guanosine(37)-N1)-methyltransferase TrmD [Nitrospirota bacterium]